MDTRTAEAYLARIGARRDSPLRELHERHVRSVPFENLDIHLGRVITLDEDALVDKIVHRRRGGFCYELNGAFALLLRALGHDVELLAGKVFADGVFGPPFGHLALRVDGLLVDVGFGRFPLPVMAPGGRVDGVEVVDVDGDLDVRLDGVTQFRLETRPRSLDEFGATSWYHQTWPGSYFRRNPLCSLPTADGRVTVAGSKLIVTVGEDRHVEDLDDAGIIAAHAEHFGVVLDRVPGLDRL
ncbi:arylamine N-acetyltransferase [Saccharothrix violaceirubra]|uniref:N-hydroxyarylamine O-acetyltransferase n=1 Tax=Saccharothrix violaceirubra TaxID=413306 RepID=A0A7W7T947_9PSEU|nr:arylamine N-acetyltransferase [Saccharothrix violaceirubra]MBB4967575.1 N-hydroxyarylamine O-acetyltransferase [Saccharothrix violaceirubra]